LPLKVAIISITAVSLPFAGDADLDACHVWRVIIDESKYVRDCNKNPFAIIS
jgi:hypothetical protein